MNLGRYEMLAPIAAGGMASVWAARMSGAAGFEKIVAVKTMLPELAGESEYRTMFLDEARVASKLRHPNVCATFDLGEHEGALYMAMEWVDGVSLHRVLRSGGKPTRAIDPPLAARIIAGACAGLHAAHEATDDEGAPLAVVHRDVSPQNLLVSADGHVKVTDFGVAKSIGKRHATQAGQAKGKLAYMAPEQLRGANVDRRADVFALGCVLYEISTGSKPFDAPTDALLVQAIVTGAPTRPSELVVGYPGELERILARAMARDPQDRFASAEGLRIALERWLASTSVNPSDRDVSLLVHERCGEEIEQRRAQIQTRAARGAEGGAVSVTPRDADPFAATQTARRDRGRSVTIALGLGVIALGFGSLFYNRPIEKSAAFVPRPAPVAVVTPHVKVALREPEPRHEATTAPALAAVADTSVTFLLDPPDATLVVDGEAVDPGAAAVVARPSTPGEMRVVIVKATGRVDRLFVVDATTPAEVEAHLAVAEPSALAE